MKPQKILILTDFSEVAVSLLHYGMELAQYLQAQVWVQHVYYIPSVVTSEVYGSVDLLKDYEENTRHAFERVKEKLPAKQAKNLQFVVSYGDLVTEMNQLIEQEQINLVVVGNRGGGLLTNILGSNTVKVIQRAHCPVLSVPKEAIFKPFRRIALAIDLKETSTALLQLTADFARTFGSSVDLVHVSSAPIPVDIRKELHDLDQELEGVPHNLSHIHSADVEQSLASHMKGNNNDLLILLPRVHSFFDRIFQKSISRQMAYQKNVPLLSIHS